MAGRYVTLLTATHYGRMMTNAVIRSSFLSKLFVTPPLGPDLNRWLKGRNLVK